MPSQKGPLSGYAEHLRTLAQHLDRYQPPSPSMGIVWWDNNLGAFLSEPETTRKDMLKRFFALMNLENITDRDAQLEVVGAILGPHTTRTEPVTSRADLTVAELGRICQALSDWETIEGYAS